MAYYVSDTAHLYLMHDIAETTDYELLRRRTHTLSCFILGCSSANTNSNRMLRLAMLMHTSSKFHCDCPCCDIQLLCQPPRYTVHAETHYADADA